MKSLVSLPILLLLSLATMHGEDPAPGNGQKSTARVAFAQYCFWTGEMRLGQIEGVVRTEAGYFRGQEVTLVEYDPSRISLEQLASQARAAGVADRVHLSAGVQAATATIGGVTIGEPLDRTYHTAPASDQKKQLEGTPYAGLKLTPEQATKVNAFVRVNPARAKEWLTASQRAKLADSR
ncbi:MAG: hypothetical protein ACREIF_07235 [Chthoniobacterales bacterium]